MNRILVYRSAVAALVFLVPVEARSQYETLQIGRPVSGRMGSASQRLPDGKYSQCWRLRTTQRERLVFNLDGEGFDSELLIQIDRPPQGWVTIAYNDNAAGTTDSRIDTTLAAGVYTVCARTRSAATRLAGRRGSYTMTVNRPAPIPASTPPAVPAGPSTRSIALGGTVSGSLDRSDSRTDDGAYYEDWRFSGQAGQAVTIRLVVGGGLDPEVVLYRMTGGWQQIARNDDEASGTNNSRVEATLPATGEYVIRARAHFADRTGSYTLSLGRSTSAASTGTTSPSGVRRISLGGTVTGTLATSDTRTDSGAYYHDWRFDGRAGEQIVIRLVGTGGFDPELVLYRTVGGWQQVARNDDADGTNARIEATLPATGEYVIRARAHYPERTGSYTLSLAAGSASSSATGSTVVPTATSAPRIYSGGARTGSLAAGDHRDTAGRYHDDWIYSGRRGERVVITMSSSAFDPELFLYRSSAGGDSRVASDDDSGEGNSARIEITLPADDDYLILAAAHYANNTGSYTVSVNSGVAAFTDEDWEEFFELLSGLTLGETEGGSLGSGDETLSTGAYYDEYYHSGSAGERIRITMRSSAFDSYLEIGTLAMGQTSKVFTRLASNDDGGGGQDSLLEFTLPETRGYTIRATSFGSGAKTGAYTILLERQ